jgi:hypothetical protein
MGRARSSGFSCIEDDLPRCRLNVPLLPEGADDGGADEALDIGAGGELGAELMPLACIKGADEEGAEDGGLDAGPVGSGGIGKLGGLGGGEGRARRVGD